MLITRPLTAPRVTFTPSHTPPRRGAAHGSRHPNATCLYCRSSVAGGVFNEQNGQRLIYLVWLSMKKGDKHTRTIFTLWKWSME